jgi:hypothetical protein
MGLVFGIPLIKILDREQSTDGVPNIMKFLGNFLKQNKTHTGIFRVNGGAREKEYLFGLLNSGKK